MKGDTKAAGQKSRQDAPEPRLASPRGSSSLATSEEQTAPTNSGDTTSKADIPSPPSSPVSKKRGLPNPSTEEEPMAKKVREVSSTENHDHSAIVSDEATGSTISKENWQGFCEIESEPAYFSAILRDIGVQDVTVREVFALTPDLLDMLPQPIYGLILLFRYREFGTEDQATHCPHDVWFANQHPGQNSCGTLAMTNILMNSPDVKVGEHLTQFKDFTRDMTPFHRGEAFASFDYVKKIHNSFAKKMDILENDKHLSTKVKRATILKGQKQLAKSKATTKASTSRSRARRHSPESAISDDSAGSFEENGHHFIAFVPVGTSVYKLDGMDAQPTNIGNFDPAAGETWLSAASDTMTALMAAGDDEYSMVALTKSPLSSLRKKAALSINTLAHVDARLDVLGGSSWRQVIVSHNQDPPSPRMLGVEELLALHPVPAALAAQIDRETIGEVLDRRWNLVVMDLKDLEKQIMEEMGTEAQDEEKARLRRFDSGPAIKVWLEMLAANGYLEENLKRFMGKGK